VTQSLAGAGPSDHRLGQGIGPFFRLSPRASQRLCSHKALCKGGGVGRSRLSTTINTPPDCPERLSSKPVRGTLASLY